ncbi:MAG: hypothetical protein QOG21_2070 [Actinomycetota bacterium]|nr:hypothetical protein [Actinomycetota bacterium]
MLSMLAPGCGHQSCVCRPALDNSTQNSPMRCVRVNWDPPGDHSTDHEDESSNFTIAHELIRGAERARTADPLLANQTALTVVLTCVNPGHGRP